MPPLAKEDPALTSYHHFSCLGPFNGTSNPAFGMLLALLPLPTSVGTFKSLCSTSNEPSSASTWPLASGIHPAAPIARVGECLIFTGFYLAAAARCP